MTLSIPDDKLTDVELTMKSFISRKKVSKRDIQSLVGKLNWITQCVYGGRFHMRRLIDRSNSLKKPWHRSHVTIEMKKDIFWWLSFMRTFNGTVPMIDCRPSTPAVMRWAPLWTNKKVFIHSDNQAACSIINRGSCKNSVVMDSLRHVFWLSAVFNFRLKAVYYKGSSNFLADSVSRLHEPGKFQHLFQSMRNIGYF